MKKKMLVFLLVLCMLGLALPTTAFAAYKLVFSEERNLTMKTGETYQIKYSFYPEGTTGDVWFESKYPNIATVDEKTGLITAIKPGETQINAGLMQSSGNGRRSSTDAVIKLKVELANPASSFEIPSTLSVEKGTEFQLQVTMVPEGSNPTSAIQYKCGYVNLVKIDQNGLVKANNIGKAIIEVSMGNIKKTCELTITAPEGYVKPTLNWKGQVKEGWYVMRCMYNFVNIDKDGNAELRWGNPAPTYYIAESSKGTTIKTADGRYLGLSGAKVKGDKIVAQKEPYYWFTQGEKTISLWADSNEKKYMMVNAEGAKNSDGTKLTLWDNKSWTTPLNGDFQLVPAEGPTSQYVKPQTVSPFEKTKPLTLGASSVTSTTTTIFGMTIGKTTVAEMKALYGEPDDVWYEYPGIDDRTAWYFYRNNWKDMMLIGVVQPFDKELFKKNGSPQSDMPIESDTCVIEGIYTNKIDLNLGKDQKKVPKGMLAIPYRDEQNKNKQFAIFVGTTDFYYGHCYNAIIQEGNGSKIGAYEKIYYYTLNGYLATNGKKMLELDELSSFNKYATCAANRTTQKVSFNGIDRNQSSEYATLGGAPWDYMIMHALDTKKFRKQLLSGKYSKISIGYAAGRAQDDTSWEKVSELLGCCITEINK